MRKQLRQIKKSIKRSFFPELYPFGAVLMLHRIDIINPIRLWYNEHLKLSPSFLDDTLTRLHKQRFSFVTLDELAEIITKKKRARRVLAITLDDGYKDNYTNGFPIFKAHNVPFCIFVATKLPEKNMTYWWYLLEDIIIQNERITLSDGSTFICQSKQEKEQSFLDIRQKILTIPQDNFNEYFSELFASIDIDFNKYNDTLPLTWEMLQQLNKEPLATIGCHTHSHISMSGCSRQMILDDIQLSLNLMKEKAGIQMRHFAYPFGDEVAVKDYHQGIVQELDFKTIATTNDGLLYHTTDVHQLPRIFVTERNASDILDTLIHSC
jgi:peptidoglycan/xylan/chitin deacetylase (PgdA/CDA1 family)